MAILKRPTKIKLGQKVRDTLTGLEGTAISRTEWLYGCVRVAVQCEGGKDGLPFDAFVVDEPQLEVVKPPKKVATPRVFSRAGPRNDPGRAPDPGRRAMETDLTADQEDGEGASYQLQRRSD